MQGFDENDFDSRLNDLYFFETQQREKRETIERGMSNITPSANLNQNKAPGVPKVDKHYF